MQYSSSTFKLGIISGGQLGKMLIQEASKWDVHTCVMDKVKDAPSAFICNEFFQGDHTNYNDVYNFGKKIDLLTYEIENINLEALLTLKEEGLEIKPDPELLRTIKDKGLQKQFYLKNNIPSSKFNLTKGSNEIIELLDQGEINYPFVQKSRTDGYDGKGVQVIKSAEDLKNLFDVPSIIEEAIDIDKEVSVIVARNRRGQCATFPVVDMEFNQQANLVEFLYSPAEVSEYHTKELNRLAIKIAKDLNLEGILAVEFFIDKQGEILVNESAPRPHNSGHNTIEANVTSQYQQHLRAIFNYPLGNTDIISPSVMINLLGEDGHDGDVFYQNLEEVMGFDGVNMHLYGKKRTRPFRKMGHITILGKSLSEAKITARRVKNLFKVITKE